MWLGLHNKKGPLALCCFLLLNVSPFSQIPPMLRRPYFIWSSAETSRNQQAKLCPALFWPAGKLESSKQSSVSRVLKEESGYRESQIKQSNRGGCFYSFIPNLCSSVWLFQKQYPSIHFQIQRLDVYQHFNRSRQCFVFVFFFKGELNYEIRPSSKKLARQISIRICILIGRKSDCDLKSVLFLKIMSCRIKSTFFFLFLLQSC